MIQGLYEVHFQVNDLEKSIRFYKKLGLSLAWKNDHVAFLWIEREKSWLGLWQKPLGDHVFAKHIAFRIRFEDMPKAVRWLKEKGIEPRSDGRFEPVEPVVRPDQRNASLYFSDPDGTDPGLSKMYWSEWEKIRAQR